MHRILVSLAGGAALAACGRSGEPAEQAPQSAQPEGEATPRAVENEISNTTLAGPTAATAGASACLVQNGTQLSVKPLRGVGTEPFWGARIEGRCVTYSTPEDQAGTRVWTRFTGTAEQGSWTGSLDGRRFELRTSPDSRCSDGMSDTVYPTAVTLFVRGEERRGCAEPLATGNRR